MRTGLFLLVQLIITVALSQPRPDLSVVFVEDDKGRPLRGQLATSIPERVWLSKPRVPAWSLEKCFNVSDEYPYSPFEIGKYHQSFLHADTIRQGSRRYLRFRMIHCYCKNQFLWVVRGEESMRVDMPDDPVLRDRLYEWMAQRSGELSSPEVIRFRPGRFSFVELAQEEGFHALKMRLAERIVRDAEKKSGLIEVRRRAKEGGFPTMSASPAAPVAPKVEREVKLVDLIGDTAVLRLSGRVMLDGGCASNSPFMAAEVLGSSGWEEFVAMPVVQMDCGLPSADWEDHVLRIPVVEWMQAHGRAVMPGRYRLKFRFVDGAVRWTRAFELK